MFSRYTERARRVVFFARYESSEFGMPEINVDHLMLGLLREDRSVFTRLQPDIDFQKLRDELVERMPRAAKTSTSVDLPLSPGAKRVLANAAHEADRKDDRSIGTSHLLLGILGEGDSEAARLLFARGMSLETARAVFETRFEPPPPGRVPSREHGEGCVEFRDAEENRVGIAGMGVVEHLPRAGDYLVIEDSQRGKRFYRVVSVTHVYGQNPRDVEIAPHAPKKIIVRVAPADEKRQDWTDAT